MCRLCLCRCLCLCLCLCSGGNRNSVYNASPPSSPRVNIVKSNALPPSPPLSPASLYRGAKSVGLSMSRTIGQLTNGKKNNFRPLGGAGAGSEGDGGGGGDTCL